MARSRSLAVAEARPCAFDFRALLLYRRIKTCPINSVLTCSKAVTGVRPCLCARYIRLHPSQNKCIRFCIRVFVMFRSFVHCIANFPCTLLQVAVVLDIIFYHATLRVMYMLIFLTLSSLRSVVGLLDFLPPCNYGRRGVFLCGPRTCT